MNNFMTDNQIVNPDGWYGISSKIPNEGQEVLIWNQSGGGHFDIAIFKDGLFHSHHAWDMKIAHWQPLPEKPKSDLEIFMEENGLGPEDMRDDNRYPTEIS